MHVVYKEWDNHMTTELRPIAPPGTAANFALGFIVISLIIYILNVAAAIMIPFVIAVFVWYLINAIARRLDRVTWRGWGLSRFLSFSLSILILVGGLWFVYELIRANAADVIRAAPVYQKKFTDFLPVLLESFPKDYRPNPKELAGYLDVGGLITALARTFTGIAGKTLVVLFYTGFLLYEQRFFGRKLHELAKSEAAESRVHNVIRNIDIKIQRYIGVRTFISVMTGIATWILMLFFKVDFAEFWGVMAFILNFIPYVGPLVAVALPSIVALVQMGDVSILLMVAVSLSAVHIVLGSILDPRLMGDSLNLSPIAIIFFLAGWGMIWGVPGMFLSVPILAMLVIILSQFASTRAFAVLLSKTGDLERDEVALIAASARKKKAKS